MKNTITIIHTNNPFYRISTDEPAYILSELIHAHKLGAAGVSVHCQEPFISGCITAENEANQLIEKFN